MVVLLFILVVDANGRAVEVVMVVVIFMEEVALLEEDATGGMIPPGFVATDTDEIGTGIVPLTELNEEVLVVDDGRVVRVAFASVPRCIPPILFWEKEDWSGLMVDVLDDPATTAGRYGFRVVVAAAGAAAAATGRRTEVFRGSFILCLCCVYRNINE